MSGKQIAGILILVGFGVGAIVGWFAVSVKMGGWRDTLIEFGCIVLTLCVLLFAAWLITDA